MGDRFPGQRDVGRTALTLVAVVALAARSPAASSPQASYGAESPQAAASAVASALAQRDYQAAVAFIAPADREELLAEVLTGLLYMLELTDPDKQTSRPEGLSPTELEAKRRDHAAAREKLSAMLERHLFVDLFAHPSHDGATQLRIQAGIALSDSVAALRDLIAIERDTWPLFSPNEFELTLIPFELSPVTSVKVRGDTATARSARRRLDFVRVEGRWYMRVPAPKPRDFF